MPTKHVIRIGELFAGAGGSALGAKMARCRNHVFKHVWANDIDRDSCNTLKKNFDRLQPACCPIQEFQNCFKNLPAIDGLVFGFPCNDFSVVGEQRGIPGEYGGLYTYGVKALKQFKPKFFVAENVTGLMSVNKKKDFHKILSKFRVAGYIPFPHVYSFEQYGIPQRRKRIVIVGFHKDLNIEFCHPKPNGKIKTAKEAIEEPPISDNAKNHEMTAQSPQVVERLKYIKPGQNAFTADLPKRLTLNMKSGAMISQIYRRLNPNEPSYTVTGSGGGGTHIYHWKENRALTNRERARLQTFPDRFGFVGGKESVRKQIGMAVPPKGACIIFKQIAKIFSRKNFQYVGI